ncbi:MAG: E2 ligase fold family C protein [Chloroflexi bacterium]|nr:E2 ligase fold family C protein [Chloroflexota bacterium]MCY3695894.1 E2 ligase fold family C protein [Chloroflexota bacterium]
MALADYFHRDTVAISQVLEGFETDVFVERLEKVCVAIAFGEEAATASDGRDLLDLTVRLAARLYPHLMFATVPAGEQRSDELIALAKSVNPNIEILPMGAPNAALAVGADAPAVDSPTIYAGCDGWVGRVGTQGPYRTSDSANPFGAGFAACLAAANLFRLFFLPDGSELRDVDTSYPPDATSFPPLTATEVPDPLVLVGAGAVGNSAVWALARSPLDGQIWIVDPETVELSNLQRYVLCERSDENRVKVEIADRAFQNSLRPLLHQGTWGSFVEGNGYKWERVLVALDSARDRRAVQASLPHWIANAWTQVGDLGVSSHTFLGSGACLACLYLPTEESQSEDQVIANGLRIPELQGHVRNLLGSGQGTDRELCEAIAAAWEIAPGTLEPYVGRPIRELWVEGVCGGGVIPLGVAGQAPRELHVPLAFQSALAGVLLVAEAVRDVLTAGAQRKTLVYRLDLLRPLGDTTPMPALKARSGLCICEDQDFTAAYRAKHGIESGDLS